MGIFSIRKTHEEFLKEANEKHKDKGYEYPEKYNGARVRIKIICPIHGCITQTPYLHLRTCGCPKCGLENKNIRTKTKEQFVKEANSIFIGRGYEYPDDYKGSKAKMRIICPKHGVFRMRPNNHISQKQGCPLCKDERKTGDTEWFIKKSKEHPVHKDKNYDYSKTEYKTCRQKVIIICPIHKEFLQTPIEHMRGNGCPTCKKSKGEITIKLFLDTNKIRYIPQYKFSDCKNINLLSFDFYLPDYNIALEFQGKQHYTPTNCWSGKKGFEKTIKRDSIKREYCLSKGISLIEIRYDDDTIERLTKVFSSLPSQQ